MSLRAIYHSKHFSTFKPIFVEVGRCKNFYHLKQMIVFLQGSAYLSSQTKLRLDMSNSNSMILLSAPLGNEWCLTCRLKEMFRPFYFWLGSGVWQYQFLCFPTQYYTVWANYQNMTFQNTEMISLSMCLLNKHKNSWL